MNSNWYGFDHEEVNKRFEGHLTYLSSFCVNGEYNPVAVYKASSPNREKGHKNYLLLQIQDNAGKRQALVRGMNAEEIEPFRYQSAVVCKLCNDIIYSVMRHDNRSCECGSISVDGGSLYFKLSFSDKTNFTTCTIDLLTNEIFKFVELTKGQVTKVDLDDFDKVNKYSWRAIKKPTYYASRSWNENGKVKSIKMHREILGITDSKIMVDHINHDTLDNRKKNLRLCTNSQNQGNSKLTKRSTTGYKGVKLIKDPRYKHKKYQAKITVNNKVHFLGCFYTAEQAAEAYNNAAIKYFGEFAKLNVVKGKLNV